MTAGPIEQRTQLEPVQADRHPRQPLRICMVSDNYYPYVGGIPDHIHNLSVELRKRGHTVKVLTTNFGGKTVETLPCTPDEDQVYRIGTGLLVRSNKSFARVPIAWRPVHRVKRYFAAERFNIIHIHGSLAPTLPLVAIRASESVNVITLHSDYQRSIPYVLFWPEFRPYFHHLHGLVAVSERARDSTARYFPGPYRIIPNAVDVETFRPDVTPIPELDNGRPKVLFLGRFEPRKGLKYLLMAMPEIVRQVPDVQLIVVGAGLFGYAYKGYLDKEVEEHVHWAGLVPNDARPHYYASCDVYCSPAIGFESFGIVLLEAMASAKPVVASDIEGYRKVLEHGREGLLVPPRDVDGIAAAIVQLLKDPTLRQKMGAAGRQKALRYSWSRVADQVESLYYELLQAYPVPRLGRRTS
ncbi:MAG: glycosyltransferase family 4 protein [candidate division WOR-3 bacterium]